MTLKPIVVRGVHEDERHGREFNPTWPNVNGGVTYVAAQAEGPGNTADREVIVHLTPFDLYRLLGTFTAAHFHGSKEDWQAWVRVMNMLKAADPEMAALKAAGLGVQ